MNFFEGLAEDIRKNLLEQLRVLWTHTSTALEGNSLSLGETAFAAPYLLLFSPARYPNAF